MQPKHIFVIGLAVAMIFIGFQLGNRFLASVGTPPGGPTG